MSEDRSQLPAHYRQLVELLEHEDITYQRDDDLRAVRILHVGAEVQWECFVQVWVEENALTVYSSAPLNARAETLATTSEFVHRANAAILVGNFELDLDDGEVRFKTTVGFGPSGTWSDELARVALYTNLAAMEHYIVSLLAVITGEASDVSAVLLRVE